MPPKRKPKAMLLSPDQNQDHHRPAERIRSVAVLKGSPSRRARTLVRITPEMRVLADNMREPDETLSGFFYRLMQAEARRQLLLASAQAGANKAASKPGRPTRG